MTNSWGGAPPSSRKSFESFIGRPVIVILGGVRRGVAGQYGVQDLPHVTLVSLVGTDAGAIYPDIIAFKTRLRDRWSNVELEPGYHCLVMVTDAGKTIDVEDPEPWAIQVANAWNSANPGLLEKLKAEAITDFQAFVEREKKAAGQQRTATSVVPPDAPPAGAPPQTYTPRATEASMSTPSAETQRQLQEEPPPF